MTTVPAAVLDASALIAFLHGEPGADTVAEALAGGAAISAANWAEVLTKLADLGQDPDAVADRLTKIGVLGAPLAVHPLDEAAAREVARLRASTRAAGLSLGDRACLALAKALAVPALTTDRAWGKTRTGAKVRVIR